MDQPLLAHFVRLFSATHQCHIHVWIRHHVTSAAMEAALCDHHTPASEAECRDVLHDLCGHAAQGGREGHRRETLIFASNVRKLHAAGYSRS